MDFLFATIGDSKIVVYNVIFWLQLEIQNYSWQK